MKRMLLLAMAFSITVLLSSVICCTGKELPITVAQLQQFGGEWIVSDFQEGDSKTRVFDGDTVTIVKRDGVYYLDGPDWFFAEARFKLYINILVGTIVPDVERLKTLGPNFPDSVLASACGKIVFNGTLTMLQDGRIVGEHDNWKIRCYTNLGILQSVQRYPGFYRFVLTRKK